VRSSILITPVKLIQVQEKGSLSLSLPHVCSATNAHGHFYEQVLLLLAPTSRVTKTTNSLFFTETVSIFTMCEMTSAQTFLCPLSAGYDVSTISKYLDWIGVMDYDIHGSWDKRTGHIAPMYAHPEDTHDYLNVNTSIHHWMKRGADPSKLIMGIPLYGNSFTLSEPGKSDLFAPTSGPGERGQFTNQGGILAYYEICSQRWDRKVQDENWRMGPFMVKGNQWISYDDKATIIRKTQYIKANGLGGAMIWALDFDDFSNLCGNGKYPLLKTVQGSLLGNDSFSRSQRKRSAKISFRY